MANKPKATKETATRKPPPVKPVKASKPRIIRHQGR